ncbi:MAG: hypothetical protein R3290_00085 [Acidimicrobiia bacterium]|nr:hypothetical protein [Acidimicrobiia bacterium]
MDTSVGGDVLADGAYVVARVGGLFFPLRRVEDDDHATVADLGRYSSLAIYFGRGQRVRLSDGREWRITAVRHGGGLSPVVADEGGRRVAQAVRGVGNYGITTASSAYSFDPAEGGRGRARRWLLTHHEATHAAFSRRPHTAIVHEPIPTGVGLLGLLLALFGIPGEGGLGLPRPW